MDACGSLACEGGTPGKCQRSHSDSRFRMKVTCKEARAPTCSSSTSPHEIASIVCPTQTLTSKVSGSDTSLYDKVKRSVIRAYDRLSSSCSKDSCEQGDFAGAVLRMAGHDFMDWNSEERRGGSDGCVNFEDDDNLGLKPTLCGEGEFKKGATLNEAYKSFCGEVSYADFLVIAAEAVMIRTRPDYMSKNQTSPSLSFDFKFGRTTATSCKDAAALPNPVDGCEAVDNVFNKRMELNDWRLSTALMGVHTLGRMRKENSGFEGWWNTGAGAKMFNNDFYQSMTVGWLPVHMINGHPGKHAWVRADSGPDTDLFLDTDLCLYQAKDLKAADADVDTCHWSIVSNSTGGNANFCLKNGQRDTDSDFPFTACCVAPRPPSQPPSRSRRAVRSSRSVEFLPDFIGRGAATDAVVEFALDEAAWLSEFKKAWKMATENNL